MPYESINGTVINCALMLAGGVLGLFARGKAVDALLGQLIKLIAIFALIHGIGGAIHGMGDGDEPLALVTMTSLCVGYVVGHLLKIDRWFGEIDLFAVEPDEGRSAFGNLLNAFAVATALSLIGPLSVLGPIDNAIHGDISKLIIKGGLDAIATFVLASRFGPGAIASVVPVFMFQATLSVLASYTPTSAGAWPLSEAVGSELSSVGGVILVFLALNILGIKRVAGLKLDVNVLKLLPALVAVPPVYRLCIYVTSLA